MDIAHHQAPSPIEEHPERCHPGAVDRVADDARAGIIPDGVLVRISTVMDGPKVSFAVNRKFAADLMAAVSPEVRRVLVGDQPTLALGRDLGGRA
jgi:hypothetical protein